ncbi:peptidoglycan DD-metalloendopeptidase family protein [Luteitalea sp.]|uniref:peptidoglycan DD-metalloendopeptidase family protein n=1 Tax=Luteitalea sp. TaxID=2004800 RepID=UPI0025BD627B|nr:peptidoglycan DD-metalloendopeptidase family protein [Luteitalea sp.]
MSVARLSVAALLAAAALIAGCATSGPLSRFTTPASPHDGYLATLTASGLSETALGRDWLAAGALAVQRPVSAASPFQETGYFPPAIPSATAYRLDLPRGRRLSIEVTMEASAPTQLFVDLFALRGEAPPERVASLAADATTLVYDVPRDGSYVVRVQPELLRGGRYTITERTLASLAFPVQGLTARAVQSQFGAQRDAGRREHEGLDIFAPRGTPVVAVSAGIARTGTNGLGGNVVWVRDARRSYYYAHLDRWETEGVRTIAAGTVLGYVGNTGNARTTAPHLHFGIYEGSAIDPLPFLAPDDAPPDPAPTNTSRLGTTVRTAQARVPLRPGLTRTPASETVLPQGTIAQVVGQTATAYRLHLPDGSAGYVNQRAVTPGDTPWRRERLQAGALLRERPSATAPVIETLDEPRQADVLGTFGTFRLVRVGGELEGWVGDGSLGGPAAIENE